ncbi:dynein axonemal heavy chain 3-like [Zootoca vivipara]|uniref:dynein axonemal heavy chain 3-like n=1 Tax=Zootoca vivipara TaxID=8524 RepID=UPI00293BC099|nr:dynein axonemal heavy chain 3-like [Zootoca vivipara]
MPMELTALHPEQIQTSAEMEKTVTLLEKETIEVSDAKEQLVGAHEKEANEVAALAKVIQEQCEGDLAEAMPVLEDALLAPDMLNPANTSFLKVQSEHKKGITQKKEHGNNPEVAVMPMELTALHLEQIQTSAEMEKTVTLLEKETIEVSDAKEQLVGADEKEANEVAALAQGIQELSTMRADLNHVIDWLQDLQNEIEELNNQKKVLEKIIHKVSQNLDRAEKLFSGLGGK